MHRKNSVAMTGQIGKIDSFFADWDMQDIQEQTQAYIDSTKNLQ